MRQLVPQIHGAERPPSGGCCCPGVRLSLEPICNSHGQVGRLSLSASPESVNLLMGLPEAIVAMLSLDPVNDSL